MPVCGQGVTKIRFCTDGVLLREMLDDPLLTRYRCACRRCAGGPARAGAPDQPPAQAHKHCAKAALLTFIATAGVIRLFGSALRKTSTNLAWPARARSLGISDAGPGAQG